MAELPLRAGTRTLTVRLVADGDGLRAAIDGEMHALRAAPVGPPALAAGGTTVEELALEVDGRPHRALVARGHDRVLVALAGRVYRFGTGEAARAAGSAAAGSGTVVAPMPGRVVAVRVAAGDAVEAGQPLVTLEAMKMETTLTADVAGTVAELRVSAGRLVDAGDVLVQIA